MKKAIYIIIMILFALENAAAQPPKFWAKAVVDSTSGTVGDVFNLDIEAVAESSLTVVAPASKDGFGKFQVHSVSEPIIEDSSQYKLYKLSYQISAYETGELYLPSISIKATDSRGSEYIVSTDSIRFDIQSVLPVAAGDSLPMKDIKPIFDFPIPVYYYLILALALILIAAAIYLYLRHRKRMLGKVATSERPADPPWVTALKMLDDLKEQKLLERGEFRGFFFVLSEIGKFYVDKRFDFPAIEKTTFEIIDEFHNHKPSELDDRFIEFLMEADLVKFAKQPSSISQGRGWLDYIENLVITTKPSEGASVPKMVGEARQ